MIGKTERVILVKGDATKWYDQVIFVVNKNAPAQTMPVDFVAEAEKIINDYNLKCQNPIVTPSLVPVKQKSKSNFLLYLAMVVACLAVSGILTFSWLR